MSCIILLNGTSNSGKSTVAKALQQLMPEPWLHVQMDSFIDMLPSRYIGTDEAASEGFHFVKTTDDKGQLYAIKTGAVGERLIDGMRQSIGALADAGNDIILDEVLYGHQGFLDYSRYLLGHKVFVVKVSCPLHVAEAREKKRQDRITPHVRSQFEVVNTEFFDFELDTSNTVADVLAQRLKNAVEAAVSPIALVQWQTKYSMV